MLPCKKSCFLSSSCRSLMQNITSMPIKTYIGSFISVQISIRQNLQKWRTLMHFLIVFNWRCHLIMLEPWQLWLCAMYCAFAKKLFALVQKKIVNRTTNSYKYKVHSYNYYVKCNLAKIKSCSSRVYFKKYLLSSLSLKQLMWCYYVRSRPFLAGFFTA